MTQLLQSRVLFFPRQSPVDGVVKGVHLLGVGPAAEVLRGKQANLDLCSSFCSVSFNCTCAHIRTYGGTGYVLGEGSKAGR